MVTSENIAEEPDSHVLVRNPRMGENMTKLNVCHIAPIVHRQCVTVVVLGNSRWHVCMTVPRKLSVSCLLSVHSLPFSPEDAAHVQDHYTLLERQIIIEVSASTGNAPALCVQPAVVGHSTTERAH